MFPHYLISLSSLSLYQIFFPDTWVLIKKRILKGCQDLNLVLYQAYLRLIQRIPLCYTHQLYF